MGGLCVAVMLFIIFIVVERRAQDPIIKLQVFLNWAFNLSQFAYLIAAIIFNPSCTFERLRSACIKRGCPLGEYLDFLLLS